MDDKILTDSGFYWRELNGLKVLVCLPLEENGFANGFSTRIGGVSPFPENALNLAGFEQDSAENISENRRRFLAAFDDDYILSSVWQTHGTEIKVVDTLDSAYETDDKCDAILSDLPGVLAGVKTADCVPILLADPVNRAYAAVHAGWRGTAESIVKKVILSMESRFGSVPSDLICAVGPAASGRSYEIGQDVIDIFEARFADSKEFIVKTRPGHALIDLHQANKDQMASSGVRPENIYIAPFCTMESNDIFFSYRAENAVYGRSGRSMSVIGLKRDK